jgi:CBS domain-containing protein
MEIPSGSAGEPARAGLAKARLLFVLRREKILKERAVTVRDVMTPTIHQVSVTASVAEVARIMVEQHIHRLVVTQGKEPVGIITSMDLLKMIADLP